MSGTTANVFFLSFLIPVTIVCVSAPLTALGVTFWIGIGN